MIVSNYLYLKGKKTHILKFSELVSFIFYIIMVTTSKVKDNANGKLVYHMESKGKWQKNAQKTHIFA